ncbi:hypothetical protein H5185_20040 [Shewanella sp. SG44-6]|uniref:hypothetical protein n=1 Tax=Shewanella sp. SG44-6 TaxID=2760959 RepID=UPI001601B49C|nr:hypothetical protein [Shewanella sp. SG44-6]MBB1391681.1 hypothetical protein [Shewanella sp. SG44-6]
MKDTVKWEFYLDGDSRYFRDYSKGSENSYFNISGGIDHHNDCMNDDFRLSSVYFDDEDDPEVVWQIGYELASLYNGISSILSESTRKLELADLLHHGVRVGKPPKRNIVALLEKPDISFYSYNQEFERVKSADVRFFMMNLATEREDAYLILKYFDIEGSYINYYKTLETLEELSKKTGIAITVDEKLRKAFTNTANSYTLSGLDSRHGFKQEAKKNKTPSMELSEAHSFIVTIAKEYLNELANGVINGKHNKSFKL